MQNRRTVVVSLAGALVGAPIVRAWASQAVFPGPVTDDTPKATVIKGTPAILDFGDGLRIPMSKAAFLTLWESKTFWMTYGAGRSSYSQRAQGEAVLYATGAMKLLLMTLAFAPARLDHVDSCGWRLKVQNPENYVHGDIDLPGKPFWPINDANFTHFGDTDSSELGGSPATGGSPVTSGSAATGSAQGSAGPSYSVAPTGSFDQVDAFTAYIVKKKDVSLDAVRARARLL